MTLFIESLFLGSAFLLFYAYVGYPIIILLLGKWQIAEQPQEVTTSNPTVSILLIVHNEAGRVHGRIQNLLQTDYPKNLLEIIVVSDGSTDGTDAIIENLGKELRGIVNFVSIQLGEKRGKVVAIEAAVRVAQGEILVLADARQEFQEDSISLLISALGDPSVGAVSGQLIFREKSLSKDQHAIGENISNYWIYEKWLRSLESYIGVVSCVTGAIYAIRKSLMPVIPDNLLVEDLFVTLHVLSNGYQVLYEPRSLAFDHIQEEGKELSRKKRTLCGNFQIIQLILLGRLTLPFKGSFVFYSHKAIRLFIPVILVNMLISSCYFVFVRGYVFMKFIFLGQIVLYILALFQWLSNNSNRFFISRVAYSYVALNIVCVQAFYKFIKKDFTW